MIRTFLVNCEYERAEYEVKALRLELDIEVAGIATDGARGLEEVRRADPDLVITCVGLPSLSGLDMIRKLRQGGSHCKIVVATAGPTREADALEAGADGFISLPPSIDEFIGLVRRVMAG